MKFEVHFAIEKGLSLHFSTPALSPFIKRTGTRKERQDEETSDAFHSISWIEFHSI